MANWVYNRIKASNKVIKDLIDSQGHVTFEKIVPIPKELLYIDKVVSKDENRLFPEFYKAYLNKSILELQESYNISKLFQEQYKTFPEFLKGEASKVPLSYIIAKTKLKEETDCDNWMSWSSKNWGCSRYPNNNVNDGYDLEDDELTEVEFETPWAPPENFFAALVSKYPAEEILMHSDEESCAFSTNYISDCTGLYHTEEVFPEYYTPYLGDEEYLKDTVDGITSIEEVKSTIIEDLSYGSTEPNINFMILHESDGTLTLNVKVYNWDSLGRDLLYEVDIKNLKEEN